MKTPPKSKTASALTPAVARSTRTPKLRSSAVVRSASGHLIGRVLRSRRLELRMTLREVGLAAGLGVGFLSQIERDQSSPSVATLIRLCRALGITVGSLFRSHHAAALIPANARERSGYSGKGIDVRLLTSRGATELVACICKMNPHAASGKELHTIESHHELVFVMSGDMVMEFDNERYELHAGDALNYDPRRPHRYFNPSRDSQTVFFCTLVPPPA